MNIIFDINRISANWTETGGAMAVPEPSSAVLLALGCLCGVATLPRFRGDRVGR